MDDLLKDFLVEATEHVDAASAELVRLERNPGDAALIASLFRHIHTIKGSSGFLSLPRIGKLAHCAETLIGRLRDGATPTPQQISLILAVVDRLSMLIDDTGAGEAEPIGDDADLVAELEATVRKLTETASPAPAARVEETAPLPEPSLPAAATIDPPAAHHTSRAGETVRVSVGMLDRLMGIVSELVLTRNQLLEIASDGADEAVKSSVQNLSAVTSDLQDTVMRVRMQPVARLFSTLPRLVRDLSIDLGKNIQITMIGAETELDRQVIELIRAPLTHIIRNAADHGVERVPERVAAGKPEAGSIRVSATYDAGQITIEVKDDGRGLDLARIRDKAVAKGLATRDMLDRMTESDIYQFVMLPGFSTAEKISKVSGRGVGMDVVRENIQSIGGTVSLNSTPGRGATVTMRIPLTLAIAPALILSCGGARFAIPQIAVVEVVGVGEGFEHAVRLIYDAPVLQLRGEALPLLHLASTLELSKKPKDWNQPGFAVILRVGAVRFGLLVETIADVQEVVIEPLVGVLARLGIFSGQTILGDGSVVLLLDPAVLVERAGLEKNVRNFLPAAAEAWSPERQKTRIVIMRAGDGPLKALPMSLVMRIEEVETALLSPRDDHFLLMHEDRLLPVIPAVDGVAWTKPVYPVLILAGAGQALALLVEEIVDVAAERLELQRADPTGRMIGSVNLGGAVVDLLDITYYIDRANPGALAHGVDRRPHILLVDDKQFFRDMLNLALMSNGYVVTVAESGQEALQLLEKGLDIQALVTDIDMPEMDGYALARAVLARPGLADLPVVALAPQASVKISEAAQMCGVRAIAGKFDRRALLAVLEEVLQSGAAAAHAIETRVMKELAA